MATRALDPKTGQVFVNVNGQWVPEAVAGMSFGRPTQGMVDAVARRPPPPEPEPRGAFEDAGASFLNALGAQPMEALGGFVGSVGFPETGQDIRALGEGMQTEVTGPQSIEDIDWTSPGSVGRGVLNMGANAVGSIVGPVVGGGAGALVGGVVAGPPGAVAGGLAGSGLVSFGLNSGDLANELADAYVDQGMDPEEAIDKAAPIALGAGVPIAALDVFSLTRIFPFLKKPAQDALVAQLEKIGGRSLVSTVVRGAGGAAVSESVPEMLQEGIQGATVAAATDGDYSGLPMRMANAGIAGAFGGAPLGAVFAPGERARARTELEGREADAAAKAAAAAGAARPAAPGAPPAPARASAAAPAAAAVSPPAAAAGASRVAPKISEATIEDLDRFIPAHAAAVSRSYGDLSAAETALAKTPDDVGLAAQVARMRQSFNTNYARLQKAQARRAELSSVAEPVPTAANPLPVPVGTSGKAVVPAGDVSPVPEGTRLGRLRSALDNIQSQLAVAQQNQARRPADDSAAEAVRLLRQRQVRLQGQVSAAEQEAGVKAVKPPKLGASDFDPVVDEDGKQVGYQSRLSRDFMPTADYQKIFSEKERTKADAERVKRAQAATGAQPAVAPAPAQAAAAAAPLGAEAVAQAAPQPNPNSEPIRQPGEATEPVTPAVQALPSARIVGPGAAIVPDQPDVPVEYAVVEADDVFASQNDDMAPNPAYLPDLQPRDRTRAAAEQQVNKYANTLDPRRLDKSLNWNDGAPIVGPDGMVDSGNGRTLAIKRAYDRNLPTAQTYRDYLEQQGYPVEGMQKPMLVRIDRSGADIPTRVKRNDVGNKGSGLAMSATEKAMSDARLMGPELFSLYRGGDLDSAANRPLVRKFMERVMTTEEAGQAMTSDGMVNQSAVRQIQNAVLARAYGDSALLEKLVESTDNNIKAIGGALLDVAPTWVQMRDAIEAARVDSALDMTDPLIEAAKMVSRARSEGALLGDMVTQQDAFSGRAISVDGEAVLRLMYRDAALTKPLGRDKLAERLQRLAEKVLRTGDGADMFGATPSRSDLLRDATEGARREAEAPEQPDLLSRKPKSDGDAGGLRPRGDAARPAAGAPVPQGDGREAEEPRGKPKRSAKEKRPSVTPTKGAEKAPSKRPDKAARGTDEQPKGRPTSTNTGALAIPRVTEPAALKMDAETKKAVEAAVLPVIQRLTGGAAPVIIGPRAYTQTKHISVDLGLAAAYSPHMNAIIVTAFNQNLEAWSTRDLGNMARHEAIHFMRTNKMFPPEVWKALEAESKRTWIKTFDIERRYGEKSEAIKIEEGIAHAYAAWASGRLQVTGLPRRGFGIIREFLASVRRALRVKGYSSIEDIFSGIEEGKFAAEPSTDIKALEDGSLAEATNIMALAMGGTAPSGTLLDVPVRETWRASLARNYGALNWVLAGGNERRAAKVGAALDATRSMMQDRYLPILRAQQAIEKATGKALPLEMQPHGAEERMHSKIFARMNEADRDFREPIMKMMARKKIAEADVDLYLTALHAKERNEQIDSINPEAKVQGRGSGYSDAEADDIIRTMEALPIAPELKRIAMLVREMLDQRLDIMVETGRLSQEQADKLRDVYPNYVPLRGVVEDPDTAQDPEPILKSGRGFMGSRKPTGNRATGRFTPAPDVLATAMALHDEAVILGERNVVGRAFYDMASAHPDPKMWEAGPVETKAVIDKKTGLVTYRATADAGPDVMKVRIDGKEYRVKINNAELLKAIQNLEAPQIGPVVRAMMWANRWMSALNTTLNPEFFITNAFRDAQTAAVNLQGLDQGGIIKAAARHYAGAVRGSYGYLSGGKVDTAWRKWAEDMAKHGGQTAFHDMRGIEGWKKRLENEAVAPKGGRALMAWIKDKGRSIEHMNNAVDNGMRLAVYRALVEKGVNRDRAAGIVKNLTINFNRRGSSGPTMNALFLFFNAAVQGTATLAAAAKSPRVRKWIGAIVAAGALQDMLGSMFSPPDPEDENRTVYDSIPEYVKQRSMILWTNPDGSYFSLPMPYGYNFFHNMGRILTRQVRGGVDDTGMPFSTVKTLGDVGTAFANAFVPPGFDSLLPMPTVASPLLEIAVNKDYAGRSIAPDRRPGDTRPESQLYYPSTPGIYTETADILNTLSGGDHFRPGVIDVSPDGIQHVVTTYLGGLGRFVSDVGSDVWKLGEWATGLSREEPEFTIRDIPFARRVVGELGDWRVRDMTYNRIGEIETLEDEAEAAKDQGDRDQYRALRAANGPLIDLATEGRRLRRALADLRAEKRDVLDGDASNEEARAALERIDEREKRLLEIWNRKYLRALGRVRRREE